MLLALTQVVVQISPSLCLEPAHQIQFSLNLGIWSDLALLGAVDKILEHSALDRVRDDIAREAPDVQAFTPLSFFLDAILDLDHLLFSLGLQWQLQFASRFADEFDLEGEASCVLSHVFKLDHFQLLVVLLKFSLYSEHLIVGLLRIDLVP